MLPRLSVNQRTLKSDPRYSAESRGSLPRTLPASEAHVCTHVCTRSVDSHCSSRFVGELSIKHRQASGAVADAAVPLLDRMHNRRRRVMAKEGFSVERGLG